MPNIQGDVAHVIFSVDEKKITAEMFALAVATRSHAIRALDAPKTGRVYRRRAQGGSAWTTKTGRRSRRKKKMILHRASAAGEAPAVDTGTMKRHIHTDKGELSARVGVPNKLKYPAYLERGYSTGKRLLRPRPWLLPATTAALKNINPDYSKLITVSHSVNA